MTAQQNLVLVTVDCLRADHVGWHGVAPSPTPRLDALAAESRVFENAIVAGLPTYYSFPAIMAGRFPLRFGRDFTGITAEEPTLASVLADQGYDTAAFVAGNPYAGRWSGYARGFHTFQDFMDAPKRAKETSKQGAARGDRWREMAAGVPGGRALFDEIYFRYAVRKRADVFEKNGWEAWRAYPSAQTITQAALAWLTERRDAPFFLWLHYMDAHRPFFPSSIPPRRAFEHFNFWIRDDISLARRKDSLKTEHALYDASIRDVDGQVARVSDALQVGGAWDKTVLAVTADHGEAFLERGEADHDPLSLTAELTHVPLLIHAPAWQAGRAAAPVSLIDLAPTLLQLLGMPIPLSFEGVARTGTADDENEIVIAEVVGGRTRDQILSGRAIRGGPRLLAAQTADFKLVIDFAAGRFELFDLKRDPNEKMPLQLQEHRATAARLLRAAKTHLQKQNGLGYTLGQLDVRMELVRAQLAQRKTVKA